MFPRKWLYVNTQPSQPRCHFFPWMRDLVKQCNIGQGQFPLYHHFSKTIQVPHQDRSRINYDHVLEWKPAMVTTSEARGVWDKGSNGACTPMKATRGQGREVGGSQPCNFLLEPPKGGKGIKLEQVFEHSIP